MEKDAQVMEIITLDGEVFWERMGIGPVSDIKRIMESGYYANSAGVTIFYPPSQIAKIKYPI
jgi:hypothetical protein